ncbi:TerB family tellurite resistance protein [Deltaproteobacteria bacterium TL4]
MSKIMSISRKELLSILTLATHMSQCDGAMALNEKKILLEIYKAIKVSKEEQAFLLGKKVSIEKVINEIQTAEIRKLLVEVLLLVSAADGTIDTHEEDFIFKIMKRLNMKKSNFIYFDKEGKINVGKLQEDIDAIMKNIKLLATP